MNAHAAELIPYLLTALGFLAVYVLNGIKSEIKEIKATIGKLEADMRGGVASLDRRMAVVEERCKMDCGK